MQIPQRKVFKKLIQRTRGPNPPAENFGLFWNCKAERISAVQPALGFADPTWLSTPSHVYCAAQFLWNKAMAATKITVRIDSELANAAKLLAARRGTSVSRLVSEQLEVLLQRDGVSESAKCRALERLSHPADLRWQKPRSRDALHERR